MSVLIKNGKITISDDEFIYVDSNSKVFAGACIPAKHLSYTGLKNKSLIVLDLYFKPNFNSILKLARHLSSDYRIKINENQVEIVSKSKEVDYIINFFKNLDNYILRDDT